MPNRTLAFWQKAQEIVALDPKKRGIVVLPTGTGKTTQTPQAVYEAGLLDGVMYISVPKRVLAVELASRVAEEMNVPLGGLVGYQIRGESKASQKTRILFMTEGLLRAKIRSNPTLAGVSLIIFDEFHQRSLMSDFNVALVERAQQEGSQVAFLLMSATIDPTSLATHFQCGVVDGSELVTTFPIEERYEEPLRDIFAAAAQQAANLVTETQSNGLIFMPGKAEIEQTIDALHKLALPDVTVLPLHGDLDADARHAPFALRTGVTITVATDLVETGATLPRIGWVVDSGLAREVDYDPLSDISSLKVREIRKDRLKQRRGRAGREMGGVYVGIFSKENYQQRQAQTLPEIFRVPLREVVLTIKALGLSREGNPIRLIDNPPKANWKEAKLQLQLLGLVETAPEAQITELGRQAVELGCDPREAAMLLASASLGCLREMAVAIAATQGKRLLYRPQNEDGVEADRAHILFRNGKLCDAWTSVQIVRLAEQRSKEESLGGWCRRMFVSYPALRELLQTSQQLLATMRGLGYSVNQEMSLEETLCKAVIAGLPDRGMSHRSGTWYEDPDGNEATLAHESIVQPGPDIVIWDIREISKKRGGTMRLITNAAIVPKGE